MKSLIVIAMFISLTSAATYPALVLTEVRNSGKSIIGGEYHEAVRDVKEAIEAFKSVNASCTTRYELAIDSCTTCVGDRCSDRVSQVCQTEQPSDLQIILDETVGFVSDDIPDFFTKTIPDVFVNKIGGGVIDITREAGDFLENTVGKGFLSTGRIITEEIVDANEDAIEFTLGVGSDIADGVIDLGNRLEDVAVDGFDTIKGGVHTAVNEIGDIANDVADGLTDITDAIEKGVNTAVDEIEDFGNDAVKTIGRLLGIGKRSVRMRRQAQIQPGCAQFQRNATIACRFYLNPRFCSSCTFNPNTDCPGYSAALNRIQQVNEANTWLSEIANDEYTIEEMTFEPSTFDPETGGFSGITVKASLFGKDMLFTIQEILNPFESDVAGPIIARKALQAFKSNLSPELQVL